MEGKQMNVMTDLVPHYGQPQLAAHVAELIEATNAIDLAIERQERAIEALVAAYATVEVEGGTEIERIAVAPYRAKQWTHCPHYENHPHELRQGTSAASVVTLSNRRHKEHVLPSDKFKDR
jgi:hypothetical protein